MADNNLVEGLECLGHAVNPMNVSKWKHHWRVHNRDVVWDTLMTKWVGEGKNLVQEMSMPLPPRLLPRRGRGDDCPLEDEKTAYTTCVEKKKTQGYPAQNLENWILWFLTPRERRGDPGGKEG